MPTPVYEEVTTPYEFTVRWNDGVMTGAHVGYRTKTLKNGVCIADQVEPVMPVNIGQGSGFPLVEILGQLHIDALALIDTKQAELAAANQRIAELEAQIA